MSTESERKAESAGRDCAALAWRDALAVGDPERADQIAGGWRPGSGDWEHLAEVLRRASADSTEFSEEEKGRFFDGGEEEWIRLAAYEVSP